MQKLGADHVVDYTSEDWKEQVLYYYFTATLLLLYHYFTAVLLVGADRVVDYTSEDGKEQVC